MNTETLVLSDRTQSVLATGASTWAAIHPERVTIPFGEVMAWRDRLPGSVLRVASGIVWLTQEGRAGDHVLGTGQTFRIGNRNALVAESLLGDAVVELQEP
jgi:hypothetical protein